MKRLVILGAGGYANTVKDVAEQLGYEIVAMLDDKIPGYELATFQFYVDDSTGFVVAFGNNAFRLKWISILQNASASLVSLIHPSSYVSPKTRLGEGVVILPKACINTDVVIERGCIVNIGAIVDHGTVLEEGVHVAPGAIVKGENRITALSKIDSGEVIESRKWPV